MLLFGTDEQRQAHGVAEVAPMFSLHGIERLVQMGPDRRRRDWLAEVEVGAGVLDCSHIRRTVGYGNDGRLPVRGFLANSGQDSLGASWATAVKNDSIKVAAPQDFKGPGRVSVEVAACSA